jgi:hypothetical protein
MILVSHHHSRVCLSSPSLLLSFFLSLFIRLSSIHPSANSIVYSSPDIFAQSKQERGKPSSCHCCSCSSSSSSSCFPSLLFSFTAPHSSDHSLLQSAFHRQLLAYTFAQQTQSCWNLNNKVSRDSIDVRWVLVLINHTGEKSLWSNIQRGELCIDWDEMESSVWGGCWQINMSFTSGLFLVEKSSRKDRAVHFCGCFTR